MTAGDRSRTVDDDAGVGAAPRRAERPQPPEQNRDYRRSASAGSRRRY